LTETSGEPEPIGIANAVATLPDGQLVFQGLYLPASSDRLAIVGGTKRYQTARGFVKVTPSDDDTGNVHLVVNVLP
jgi:hypothetical protein